MKSAIIGCGVVGSRGRSCLREPGRRGYLRPFSRGRGGGRGFRASVDASSAARCRVAADLADALKGADYVQESAPERLPIKQALYKEMDGLLERGAIVGSSTSGFPASSFTQGLANAARCLVAHPINPPHLIPLVELVPAPDTRPRPCASCAI